jgi:hypothetical protein
MNRPLPLRGPIVALVLLAMAGTAAGAGAAEIAVRGQVRTELVPGSEFFYVDDDGNPVQGSLRVLRGRIEPLGAVVGLVQQNVTLTTLAFEGFYVIRARRGVIYGTTVGQLVPAGPVVGLVETNEVLGGTGRFARAGGTILGEGTADPATGTAVETLSGTLRLP